MSGLLLAPIALGPSSAGAGAYHAGEASICSECHLANGPLTGAGLSQMGAQAVDTNALCLGCHDGQPGIPDVWGVDVNGLEERSAGFLRPLGAGGPAGPELARQNSVTERGGSCGQCHSPATGAMSAPGGLVGHSSLACTSCHDPHGNQNPRNLRLPSQSSAGPTFGLFVAPGAQGLEKYERSNVRYGAGGSAEAFEVSALCLDCHVELAGTRGQVPEGHHTTHPSYDSQSGRTNTIAQGAAHGTTNLGHWVGGRGSGFDGASRVPFLVPGAGDFASASTVDPGRNSVFCLSCHKAHGSASSFSLPWTPGGRGIGPRGCDQCHGLGNASPSGT